jgi:hypothetical protein
MPSLVTFYTSDASQHTFLHPTCTVANTGGLSEPSLSSCLYASRLLACISACRLCMAPSSTDTSQPACDKGGQEYTHDGGSGQHGVRAHICNCRLCMASSSADTSQPAYATGHTCSSSNTKVSSDSQHAHDFVGGGGSHTGKSSVSSLPFSTSQPAGCAWLPPAPTPHSLHVGKHRSAHVMALIRHPSADKNTFRDSAGCAWHPPAQIPHSLHPAKGTHATRRVNTCWQCAPHTSQPAGDAWFQCTPHSNYPLLSQANSSESGKPAAMSQTLRTTPSYFCT